MNTFYSTFNIKMNSIFHADIVDSISKINHLELPDDSESSAIYLRKVLVGLAKDVRVIFIKLADRLHTLRNASFLNLQEQKQKANIV